MKSTENQETQIPIVMLFLKIVFFYGHVGSCKADKLSTQDVFQSVSSMLSHSSVGLQLSTPANGSHFTCVLRVYLQPEVYFVLFYMYNYSVCTAK